LFFGLLCTRRVAHFLSYLPALTVALVLGLAGWRHATYLRVGPEHMNLFATHLRFDGLLIGTLLAYWSHFHPEKLAPFVRRPLTLIFVGLLFAAPTLWLTPEASPWTAGLGLTGVYVGFGALLLGWMHLSTAHAFSRQIFASRPAAVLGQIGFFSYSIYLWHIDLANTPVRKLVPFIQAYLPAGAVWLLTTLIYVVAAVVTGTILARIFEGPSLALRDRLFPSAAKAMAREPAVAAPKLASAPKARHIASNA